MIVFILSRFCPITYWNQNLPTYSFVAAQLLLPLYYSCRKPSWFSREFFMVSMSCFVWSVKLFPPMLRVNCAHWKKKRGGGTKGERGDTHLWLCFPTSFEDMELRVWPSAWIEPCSVALLGAEQSLVVYVALVFGLTWTRLDSLRSRRAWACRNREVERIAMLVYWEVDNSRAAPRHNICLPRALVHSCWCWWYRRESMIFVLVWFGFCSGRTWWICLNHETLAAFWFLITTWSTPYGFQSSSVLFLFIFFFVAFHKYDVGHWLDALLVIFSTIILVYWDVFFLFFLFSLHKDRKFCQPFQWLSRMDPRTHTLRSQDLMVM